MVKADPQKRGDPKNLQMLEELIRHDRQWCQNLTKLNELRHHRKQITAQIAGLKKKQQDATEEISQGRKVDVEITALEKQVVADEERVHDCLMHSESFRPFSMNSSCFASDFFFSD